MVVEIVHDGLLEFVDVLEDAAADAFRAISAKKRSTTLSHEPDVGVDTLPSIHEPLWIAVSGATPFQQAVDRAGGYAD